MSRYIPQPAYIDRMPVDISFVFADEKPAGKRGFVKAVGEDLRFEDGTLARFWGVNFNGGACFPDKDYAKKVAQRLAQVGCNLVRFHQLDAEWDTPNIFAYTKGKRVYTTRVLDEKSMDALDYLVYCLKEEGIYCYLDMITYRHYKEGDGVVDCEKLLDKGRPWAIVDKKMRELQKEYCDQLWNHYNPYTELLYKDDPVFVMTEIINEEDLFIDHHSLRAEHVHSEYYENMFREMFRDWLAENNIEFDWQNCDLYCSDDPMIQFKIYDSRTYFQEMYDYIRSLGVKIPIAGTNWLKTTASVKAETEMDFLDGHHYYYDWKWGNTERTCMNRSVNSSPFIFPNLGKRALAGKPYFVSEWDMPWPNSYRAEGPLYYAAVGALQNWSGFAIHTYAYSCLLDKMDILGRELSSPVAGVPYREGIFSIWNDPAKFGMFYHAALITRRADVSPANKKVGVQADAMAKALVGPFESRLEKNQVKTCFDGLPEGYDEVIHETVKEPIADEEGIIRSDNGQLIRDMKAMTAYIDTDRTKAVYGLHNRFARGQSNHKSNIKYNTMVEGFHVACKTDFACIALSSLTDAPICESDNMLLTTIGRARNTGAQFDGEKMLDVGHAPIMAEVIDAQIRIKTNRPNLKVWGVNAEGFYAGLIKTTYDEEGYLCFRVGDENNPACYYLIVQD